MLKNGRAEKQDVKKVLREVTKIEAEQGLKTGKKWKQREGDICPFTKKRGEAILCPVRRHGYGIRKKTYC